MIEITPIAGALGAEIAGIDLTSQLDANDEKKIKDLLTEYEVLFFRNQDISPENHKALAASFGALQQHPAYKTVEHFPMLTILETTPESHTITQTWHHDMTFMAKPPMGAVMHSKIIPQKGGDTLWSSMTTAYDALSDHMQHFLSGLTANHDFANAFKASLAEPGGRERLQLALESNPPVEHPVIVTHPISGKKVIYVNALFTTHIIGMKPKESQALLSFLYRHIMMPDFTCRFHWQVNSIAIWDNCSTQHTSIDDFQPGHRWFQRITIDGETPQYKH